MNFRRDEINFMSNPNRNWLLHSSHQLYLSLVAAAFLLTSCALAQTVTTQTNNAPVNQTNNNANRQTGGTMRIQSVQSCKVLDLGTSFSLKNFDPLGGYKIYGSKNAPEFAEFNNFTLDAVYDKNAAPNAAAKAVGGVVVNKTATAETFQIETLAVSTKDIRFSTETRDNTRYEFDGRFLKKGAFSRYNEKNTPVLKGTLRRFESDKIAVEKELEFKFVVWKARFPVAGCLD